MKIKLNRKHLLFTNHLQMKNKLLLYLTVSAFFFYGSSIAQKKSGTSETAPSIAYKTINLNDLSAFKKAGKNWNVASHVSIDRSKEKTIFSSKGEGILVNSNNRKKNKHLSTNFEHGDIEIELDVMMPVASNSGIYLQGRYEVQLYDSWGEKNLTHKDIGSIYERWDDKRGKGNQGYEGIAAKTNASKAPGLWQHLKIIFHAPKFDKSGNKTKNAWFEEVSLNGSQVIQNAEVTGPTRSSIFKNNEKAMGPLVIQGDHGPVAFKNFKYKLYNSENEIKINNLKATIYESSKKLKSYNDISKLKKKKEKSVKTISPLSDLKKNTQQLIAYKGTLTINKSSNYLFEMKVIGGGLLMLGDKTVINANEKNLDTSNFGQCKLEKGEVPFTFVYNQTMKRGKRGFELFIEGEQVRQKSLQVKKISKKEKSLVDMRFILIEHSKDKAVSQRSFLNHNDIKKTHCISVGFPQKVSYSYDLETGSLLQVWNTNFFNATHMWHSRGTAQLGYPESQVISFHGDSDFAYLKDDKSSWPKENYEKKYQLEKGYQLKSQLIQKGYKLDALKNPLFLSELNGAKISNKFIPSDSERKLKRVITVDSKKDIWLKIAESFKIEIDTDGTYLIDDNNYYIDFSGNENLTPIIRLSKDTKELLVKIPAGKQTINYNIIW